VLFCLLALLPTFRSLARFKGAVSHVHTHTHIYTQANDQEQDQELAPETKKRDRAKKGKQSQKGKQTAKKAKLNKVTMRELAYKLAYGVASELTSDVGTALTELVGCELAFKLVGAKLAGLGREFWEDVLNG
jgi:hypothetical protein